MSSVTSPNMPAGGGDAESPNRNHAGSMIAVQMPMAAGIPSSRRRPTLGDLLAFSLSSFAGGIAGVTSSLSLGFLDRFPRSALGEFRIAGLLLGFQRGLTSGSLGNFRRSQSSGLTSFKS